MSGTRLMPAAAAPDGRTWCQLARAAAMSGRCRLRQVCGARRARLVPRALFPDHQRPDVPTRPRSARRVADRIAPEKTAMKSALIVVLLAALAATGCSSTKADGVLNKNYDLSKVQRIAVVDGNNPTFKPETRQALVDSFQTQFMKKNWSVIDRSSIQKAVDELDFQNKDFTSPDERKQLGHILNVQGLVVVNVQTTGDDIALTAKLLDVESGEIIWSAQGEGNVNSGFSTAAGALLGVAAGAAIGHNAGGNAGIGAVAGGVGGGLAGRALSDSQVENARAMIQKVCETLPTR
jgi:TolB-like protein